MRSLPDREQNLYREITDLIIGELEVARVPWVQPWGRPEAVSRLAYWVAAADGRALLHMTEGFGAALATSAAMRSDGQRPEAIALSLAERAHTLQIERYSQHAGWLLLSIELELRNEAQISTALPRLSSIDGLLCEVEEIGRELIRRGTKELAEG